MTSNGYNTTYDGDENVTSLDDLRNKYGSNIINGDPSIDGPNLQLGNGQAYQFSGTTNLPGGTSNGWEEVQWSAPGYFNPTGYSTNHIDSLLGAANGYWQVGNSTNSANLGIYGKSGSYVYQMGGTSDSTYSNNIFIQTTNIASGYTLDHRMTFTANEGLQNVATANPGTVMVDNAFTVTYSDNGHLYGFFLQVQLADSRGQPGAYSTVGSNTEKIYNVATTVGVDGQTSAVEYLPWTNDYSSSLHTVTINVNEAVLAMAKAFAAVSPSIPTSSVLDMKNWSVSGCYAGIEDEYGSVLFNLQNPEIHYNENSTFSSDNTGEQITTIQGVGYIDSKYEITTMANTNTDITINGFRYPSPSSTYQSVISNGYWDTINLNGKATLAYVNGGASFNGNGGTLTESGPGNIYIGGTYSGLYITTGANSNINANLTGNGAITNNGSNVNITGNGAGLTIGGNGTENIVGTYNGLVLNNFYNNDNLYASVNGNSYINNNGGNVNLTSNGDVVANIENGGLTSIVSNNGKTLNFNSQGESTYHIFGDWKNMNGVFSNGGDVNCSTHDASIYNDGGHIDLNGLGGNLTYNGNGAQGTAAEIVGEWNSVQATFNGNEAIYATVGSNSYITMNQSEGNIWNPSGSNVNIYDNGAGNASITYGSGSTNVYIDTNKTQYATISDFHDVNGSLILSGISKDQINVSYYDNSAEIKTSNGCFIDLKGSSNVSFGVYTGNDSYNGSILIHSN